MENQVEKMESLAEMRQAQARIKELEDKIEKDVSEDLKRLTEAVSRIVELESQLEESENDCDQYQKDLLAETTDRIAAEATIAEVREWAYQGLEPYDVDGAGVGEMDDAMWAELDRLLASQPKVLARMQGFAQSDFSEGGGVWVTNAVALNDYLAVSRVEDGFHSEPVTVLVLEKGVG